MVGIYIHMEHTHQIKVSHAFMKIEKNENKRKSYLINVFSQV